jgi:hypothetical protein
MNYTKIEIEGKTIGLKFGMASFRYLQDKMADGISFNDGIINEIGIAQILYSGYYNNCLIKEEIPSFTFEYFVDYIENNINNESFLNDIKKVIEIWSNNQFIKTSLQEEIKPEAKKKNIRGKK